jgi:hypothetical protein
MNVQDAVHTRAHLQSEGVVLGERVEDSECNPTVRCISVCADTRIAHIMIWDVKDRLTRSKSTVADPSDPGWFPRQSGAGQSNIHRLTVIL